MLKCENKQEKDGSDEKRNEEKGDEEERDGKKGWKGGKRMRTVIIYTWHWPLTWLFDPFLLSAFCADSPVAVSFSPQPLPDPGSCQVYTEQTSVKILPGKHKNWNNGTRYKVQICLPLLFTNKEVQCPVYLKHLWFLFLISDNTSNYQNRLYHNCLPKIIHKRSHLSELLRVCQHIPQVQCWLSVFLWPLTKPSSLPNVQCQLTIFLWPLQSLQVSQLSAWQQWLSPCARSMSHPLTQLKSAI